MFLFDDYDLPVELVLMPEEEVVVKFSKGLNGQGIWGEHFLLFEKEMKEMGFLGFNNRFTFDSKEFNRSFYEIYYRKNMNHDRFKWHKI